MEGSTPSPPPTTKINPFHLPELMHRISRFVSLTDAIACAQVSKEWAETFIPIVWYEVDFSLQPRFADLSPDIISKHGQHIRIINNAKTIHEVTAVANEAVMNLASLRIEAAASVMHHIRTYEIVSRSIPSLESLRLTAASESVNGEASLTHFVSASSLIPFSSPLLGVASCLTSLRIERLYLTREGLMSILQASPELVDLKLIRTVIVGSARQTIRHPGVETLAAGIECLFHGDPADPSLLSYFPSLNRLCTWQEHPQIAIPTAKIKEDVARFCPLLTRYELQGSRNLVHQFLAHIGRDVSSLMYKFSHIPGDTIMDILLHQATLQGLGVFSERSGASFDEDEVEEVSEVVQEFSQFFQLIPRGCSQLKHLDLHLLEMDMDEVELGEWACKDLVVLRVRIKGLDTKERILEAIALWRQGCWRRRQEEAGAPITLEEERDDQMDLSIEARVAHHLLKLEKLRSVWLGCQTWGPI
ncbi:hypothetical protein K457DRAFT_129781 [Linnemannia elongata AG-77]|uniref:F-box domain-containing protein n=1 Tax=Linnemannia elongata AG-77 TaxID=1314771 RepID=A0A197JHG5_9FUNG|nr:hypothetical protein K457DRAFT_129781 [Linnemannia elongata AG-77]